MLTHKVCRLRTMILVFMMLQIAVPAYAETGENVISLEQAKELARAKSRTLQTLKITQDKLDSSVEMARDAYFSVEVNGSINGYLNAIKKLADEMNDLGPGEEERKAALAAKIDQYERDIDILKKMKPKGSDVERLKIAYRDAKNAYDDIALQIANTEKMLDYNMEILYFTLLDLENNITAMEKKLELLGAQLRTERLKMQLGLSTDFDEKNAMIPYMEMNKTLADLRDKEQLFKWQLNDLMGRNFDDPIKTVREVINPQRLVIDYDELVQKALDNSLEIAQKKRDIKDYTIDAKNEDNSEQKNIYARNAELAEIELAGLEENTKQKTKELIDTLDISYRAWEKTKIAKDKAALNYQNDKMKYELGLIAKLELDASEVVFLQAVNDELQSAENWYLERHKIELAADGIFM